MARQGFYRELLHADHQIDLARVALYIAQEEYPSLDPDEYLNALDVMAADIRSQLPIESYPLRIIRCINQHLYTGLGFTGNSTDYYNPDNSYFNQVIERRTGIPITLSLLYLEIAKRLDFPMVGVGMPGHFLIRPDLPDIEVFVDPFQAGDVIFLADCQAKLAEIYGEAIAFRPEFLAPIGVRQFIGRMLANLKAIYLQRGDMHRCLAAIERILFVFPDSPADRRDRGLIYYQLRRWSDASSDLEHYLASVPTAHDAPAVRQVLRQIDGNA